METNSQPLTDYFKELVDKKRKAGLSAPMACEVAMTQIQADVKSGRFDKAATEMWLTETAPQLTARMVMGRA